MAHRDLNLILAALFELRLTCLENERTWTDIGNVAEILGGDRSAMYFGAPAPDRGRSNRTVRECSTQEAVRHAPGRVELDDEERSLILSGLFELTFTRLEDDALRRNAAALAAKLGGEPDAVFFGA